VIKLFHNTSQTLFVTFSILFYSTFPPLFFHSTNTLTQSKPNNTQMRFQLALVFVSLCLLGCVLSESLFPNCVPPHIPTPARFVRELSPFDIRAVLNIGDSISAGYAIETPWPFPGAKNISEYHGDSFDIGGNPGVVTLPNVLTRVSGHAIIGAGHNVEFPISYPPNDGLVGAVSGATASEAPGIENVGPLKQAEYLYQRLVTVYTNVSLANDWKLLTIFIGVNDVCASCQYPTYYNEGTYFNSLNQTLGFLYTHIPHLFVSLLSLPDITVINNIINYPNNNPPEDVCLLNHPLHCPCASNYNYTNVARFKNTIKAYNQQLYDLQKLWSGISDEFAVVVQPFLTNSIISDRSQLSVDCFHFSQKIHKAMAIELWNNLITPSKDKSTSVSFDVQSGEPNSVIKCPTSSTRFETN